MILPIACIVEGHGEVRSVESLIRRVSREVLAPEIILRVKPIRRPAGKLLHVPNDLEHTIDLAAREVGRTGRILVLLDMDDDCPAKVGPELLKRAQAVRTDMPVAVVLAKCEFESWFLAASDSLRGLFDFPESLEAPENPEEIRNAKGWLKERRTTRNYAPTVDQPVLTEHFDLNLARQRSDSFDKCYREIVRLLRV